MMENLRKNLKAASSTVSSAAPGVPSSLGRYLVEGRVGGASVRPF